MTAKNTRCGYLLLHFRLDVLNSHSETCTFFLQSRKLS